MAIRQYAESVVVGGTPERLYDMVSDVSRMGEWSPVCRACWWDEGDSARVGAWFTGRNEVPGRTWETRSEVVAAKRGREFAFMVGGKKLDIARWGFEFKAVENGTEVTESWEFLPGGVIVFDELFGAQALAEIEDRFESARAGIPATLGALKKSAEASAGSSTR